MKYTKLPFGFGVWLLLTILCFCQKPTFAQLSSDQEAEEILLELKVQKSLTFDYSAILKEDQLYLPITRLFSLLDMRYAHNRKGSKIWFMAGPNETRVSLDYENLKIAVEGDRKKPAFTGSDFILSEDELYLHKSLCKRLFGFDFVFNYRNLELMLFADYKLQVIKKHERQEQYQNFTNPQTHPEPEITEGGQHHLLKGWVVNWMLNSSHSLQEQGYSYGAGTGGEVLGGDFSMRFTGSKNYGINWQNIRWNWRYPVYTSALVTQLNAGNQSFEDPMVGEQRSFEGIEITNRPLTPRQHFDSFTLKDPLLAGWDAELEMRGRLLGVARSTRNDEYRFEVPLSYGTNVFTVNRYDTEGYNHPRRFRIYVAPSLLPEDKVEYSLSLGRYTSSYYDVGKLDLKWGVSPFLTLGGGTHYQSLTGNSFSGRNAIPFFQLWSRLGNSVYLEAGHTLDYLSHASIRMVLPGSKVFSFRFKKFHRESPYINTRRLSYNAAMTGTLPITLPFMKLNTHISAEYFKSFSSDGFMNVYSGISTSLPFATQFSIDVQGRMIRTGGVTLPEIQRLDTRFMLAKRLFGRLLVRPAMTYSYSYNKITRSRIELSSRILHSGNLSLSVNRDHLYRYTSLLMNVSFDLPFGRQSSQIRSNHGNISLNQHTTGTVAYNRKQNNFYFDRRSWIQKAAITLDPFLDLNNNGRKEKDEPRVSGLKASVYEKGNSRPTYRERHTVTRLTAYRQYIVKVDPQSLDNPLWQPRYLTYQVRPSPNQFTHIPVPLVVTGEISGGIVRGDGVRTDQLYGLDVILSSPGSSFHKTVQTYSGGEFYYVGLKPGHYIASINKEQLAERSLRTKKDSISFTIRSVRAGDIVEGLDFEVSELESTKEDSMVTQYTIQIGAFRNEIYAERQAFLANLLTKRDVQITFDQNLGLYKCQFKPFKRRAQALKLLNRLKSEPSGRYKDAFILNITDSQDQ